MGCFDNIPLENLEHCVNAELAAGTSETEVYAIPAALITEDPALPALGTLGNTLEDIAKITDDITFPVGKGFYKLNAQSETGEVKDEIVGNKGNKKIKSSYEFFMPNTSAQNLGWLRQNKNMPMVFLVMEKTGRYRKIGSKAIPAYLETGSTTTGKGPEDDNGTSIMVSTTGPNPAPIYEGVITENGGA
jgi:hypothetical protein